MHTQLPKNVLGRAFQEHWSRNFWHSFASWHTSAPASGMSTFLQVAAILVAVAGFACLLAGEWKLALASVPVFVGLAWAWKSQPKGIK